jgi:hypothetical protein
MQSQQLEPSEADRQYLTMMYEEHAEHARQHENLRAAVGSLFMTLVAGLLAFASDRWFVGLYVCIVSILGTLLNYVHYKRYKQHLEALRAFRKELEKGVSPSLAQIRKPFDTGWLRLHTLWTAIYVVTFLLGLVVVIRGLIRV